MVAKATIRLILVPDSVRKAGILDIARNYAVAFHHSLKSPYPAELAEEAAAKEKAVRDAAAKVEEQARKLAEQQAKAAADAVKAAD